LNLFHIHGQDYGAYHDGGTSFSTRPDEVRLSDCGFRINERFRYEYDFGDRWHTTCTSKLAWRWTRSGTYPRCIGGNRRAPPEGGRNKTVRYDSSERDE
jgi:hypothetical protein